MNLKVLHLVFNTTLLATLVVYAALNYNDRKENEEATRTAVYSNCDIVPSYNGIGRHGA
jgi:hypothetical protein